MLIIQADQLREFHKQHYNPTNGHFYTYGDMPLATHLQRINEEFLCNFERVPRTESVAREQKWDKPVTLWILSWINHMWWVVFLYRGSITFNVELTPWFQISTNILLLACPSFWHRKSVAQSSVHNYIKSVQYCYYEDLLGLMRDPYCVCRLV